jgi:hypothetical protein
LREKLAAVLIILYAWGFQLPGYNHHHHQLHAINQPSSLFWHRCRGGSRRLLRGEFSHAHPLLCFIIFLYFIFTCIVLYQKPKKNRILDSCFYLSTFRFAEMANPKNTKLCDFTSTNNSDFICTPIVPPAPAANFYEINPALLNLVMKE